MVEDVSMVEQHVPVQKLQNGEVDDHEDDNGNFRISPVSGDMSKSIDERTQPRAFTFRNIRRTNRLLSRSLSSGDEAVIASIVNGHGDIVKTSESWIKNSRKPRNGFGRGLPKKGGAGGKGVWGTPGSELFEEGNSRDSGDPNYDSESEDEYVVEKTDLPVTETEYYALLEPVILEYFEHGDSTEVQANLRNVNAGKLKHKLTEKAISLALDRKDSYRELTSQLISNLYGKLLNSTEIAQGFDLILNSLADLTIDTPEAPKVVGQFIARAINDDCLPPKFVAGYKGTVDCPHVRDALEKANLLLNQCHSQVRLDNVWGVGGGSKPVKSLAKKMILLLKEYLSSGDIEEARKCLVELEVPHFHHELVYEIAVIVIEDSGKRTMAAMCALLQTLFNSGVITLDQVTRGMKRVYEQMPDLCLDVPAAYTLLELFGDSLYRSGVITHELYRQIPQRGRKRFVSEGDGGRIKDHH